MSCHLASVGLSVSGSHWIGPHYRWQGSDPTADACHMHVIADIGLGECGEWRLSWSNIYMGLSPADGSSFDFFSFRAFAFFCRPFVT